MQPTADSLRLLKREAFHCGYPSQKDNGGGYTNLPETFQKVSECILNERIQLVCQFGLVLLLLVRNLFGVY